MQKNQESSDRQYLSVGVLEVIVSDRNKGENGLKKRQIERYVMVERSRKSFKSTFRHYVSVTLCEKSEKLHGKTIILDLFWDPFSPKRFFDVRKNFVDASDFQLNSI